MKRLELTYKELFDRMNADSSVNYYVKTHQQELAKIHASIEKNAPMYEITFSNGYFLKCADSHAFMGLNGETLLAKDLVHNSRIMTLNGNIYVKSIKSIDEGKVYDISIDSPHWYVNDDVGIIHHNTSVSLYMVAAFQKKHKDGICLFYDTEFGSNAVAFEQFGIDTSRVVHIPTENIEQLKFDLSAKLEELTKKDKVIVLIDSVGNIASKKEVQDAIDEKSVSDMTRARQLKGLWRIVLPKLKIKDIPCIAINHIYMSQDMYPKAIVSGGTGGVYSADVIWIITKSQEKDGTDLVGFTFKINIEKSRTVKEKSQIPLQVTFDGGINKFSGILDLAMEFGYVVKPSNGWYQMVNKKTGELIGGKIRYDATQKEEFLGKILANADFAKDVKDKYQLSSRLLAKLVVEEEDDSDDVDMTPIAIPSDDLSPDVVSDMLNGDD